MHDVCILWKPRRTLELIPGSDLAQWAATFVTVKFKGLGDHEYKGT